MQPLVRLRGVSKSFPGVRALDQVDLDLYGGEIHGLIGENGAGKSTLIKVLTGVHQHDSGTLLVGGKTIRFAAPRDAIRLHISAVHQELALVPQLSVADNVFLGREIKSRRPSGLLDLRSMREKSVALLERVGENLDPQTRVAELAIAQQQRVEIAKSLAIETKLLILDEPTACLTGKETGELFQVLKELRNRGIAVVFASHKLEEVLSLCDKITVLRDGKRIATLPRREATLDQLISLMVGRRLDQQFPKAAVAVGEEVLRVERLTREGILHEISFYVRLGEIVGFSGLVGAGRTELMRALFGADRYDSGDIYIRGRKVAIRSPKDAMANGIAFLTEDRAKQGLILDDTIAFNANLASFYTRAKGVFLNLKQIQADTRNNIKALAINPPFESFICRQLSGGNQQKVVIAKWLNTSARIFIFDEPTKGIDVGAKVEVYNLLTRLVSNGAAVIMVSSDLPEILGMSDRIYVMHRGTLAAEFSRAEAAAETIMKAATGSV